MEAKESNDLFYTCSLIEFIGREQKLPRVEVVNSLGIDMIGHIYEYADVFHCEPIQKVAAEFCEQCHISEGAFDNVEECRYRVPGHWDIGKVYARLIEDCYDAGEVVRGIWEVYHSWIDEAISNYNTDFYYQSRGYIAACYQAGEVLE